MNITLTRRTVFLALFLSVLLPVFAARGVPAADASRTASIAGFKPEEALRLGERMYVNGILPSGEPVQSLVKGDIRVEGRQFTCANCHQRSGFGSMEGWVRTSPIDGTRLYSPLSKFKGIPSRGRSRMLQPQSDASLHRPAYTDETLARVIRTGEDPTGKTLTDTMPRYFLSDRDMAILVYYLKNLSTGTQPGVSEDTLRFATIVTDDVSKADRDAMLVPLQSFVDHWRISRNMEKMSRAQAYVQEGAQQFLRKLSLSIWELKGPADTWRKQLETYYRNEPVFAVLGGISGKDWSPIHRFCEEKEIPCIFPITDYPVISDSDWYTLYLSKGLYQEGEAAAKYLHGTESLRKDRAVIQIFRKNAAGLALAKGFEETWKGRGNQAPVNIVLGAGEKVETDFWKKIADAHPHAVVLLWLGKDDFPPMDTLAARQVMPDAVFMSAGMLGKAVYALAGKERNAVYLTYPYSLPQDVMQYRASTGQSMSPRDESTLGPDISDKIQNLVTVLNGPLSMLRSSVYRDYFLEMIESTPDLSTIPVTFPRMSFGAGQRYVSKGCYIVQLSDGPEPVLTPKSDWVIQ